MSYYSINGVSIIYPSGTILSYLGTTDPPGWLICDGNSRTATTTNQFASLAAILNTTLGISTNNGNSVVTPNLQSNFLQGRSSTTSGMSTTAGASSVTLTTANMPSHKHTISGSATTSATGSFTTTISQTGGTAYGFSQDTNTWKGGGDATGGYVGYEKLLSASTTGVITASTTLNNLSATDAGSGAAFSNLPPYFTVNYIIKI
jgi:microcystin-dependent protein